MANITKQTTLRTARDFIKFVDASPSPYHVVQEYKDRLLCARFRKVKQSCGSLDIKPMEKLLMIKNQTSIVACAVSGNYGAGNGFTMLGAQYGFDLGDSTTQARTKFYNFFCIV